MHKETNMNDDWISVSECARILGKSSQTVYNMVSSGKIKSKTFRRGSMCGILVKLPKQ